MHSIADYSDYQSPEKSGGKKKKKQKQTLLFATSMARGGKWNRRIAAFNPTAADCDGDVIDETIFRRFFCMQTVQWSIENIYLLFSFNQVDGDIWSSDRVENVQIQLEHDGLRAFVFIPLLSK